MASSRSAEGRGQIVSHHSPRLVNFFRVLRDPQKAEELQRRLWLTPYSREEFAACLQALDEGDDISRAYAFWYAQLSCFAGKLTSRAWGYVRTTSNRGMAETTAKYLSSLERLPALHERIMCVQIEHDDFRNVIPRYDTPETLFYLDPPYVPETRRSGRYIHEMSAEDHRELVEILLGIQGMALLSGYRHEVYKPLEEAGWARYEFKTHAHSAGRVRGSGLQGRGAASHQTRIDCVWVSPRAQDKLQSTQKGLTGLVLFNN